MNGAEKAPVLQTERLILRPHVPQDLDDVAALWADPAVVKYIGGSPNTREQSWARLLRNIGHWQALGFGYWVVCDRADGHFLGEVGFAQFKRAIEPALPDIPEAGWVLAQRAHGRGVAAEAVSCMHSWADKDRDWPQTCCIIDPDHVASLKVAQKHGYRIEGQARYYDAPISVLLRQRGA